jgi:hypothetical protein
MARASRVKSSITFNSFEERTQAPMDRRRHPRDACKRTADRTADAMDRPKSWKGLDGRPLDRELEVVSLFIDALGVIRSDRRCD